MEKLKPDEEGKVGVSIDLTEQSPPYSARRLRSLQVSEVNITFNAVIAIESSVKEYDVNSYIMGAFDKEEKESVYIASLKASMDEASEDISAVTFGPAESITSLQNPPADGGNSTGPTAATIGIIVGLSVVGLAGFGPAGFLVCSRLKRSGKKTPSSAQHG